MSTVLSSLIWKRLAAGMAVLFVCAGLMAQATNPAYIGFMPSVDQIKSAIQGADPNDTLARHVAVFTYLSQIIQRMKFHRSYGSPYTPDEQRVMGAYDLAAYQITQDFAKTHTPDQTKAFNQLHGRYEMDSQFYNDWYHKLLPAPFREQYEGGVHSDAVQAKLHFDAEARQATQPPASSSPVAGSNDPGAQSVRRRLELGGSDVTCLAKGVGTGLLDLVGAKPDTLTGPAPAGPILNGNLKSRTVNLNFGARQVRFSGCGQLVSDSYAYHLERKGSTLLIVIQNQPAPIALAMPSLQSLAGPGMVSVTGKIVIGTHHVWMAHYHNGVPDGTGYWDNQPIYGPKVERCTIGEFAAVQPAPASADDGAGGLISALTGVMGEMMPETTAPAALRMSGLYAGPGGLKLEFDAATVDARLRAGARQAGLHRPKFARRH